MSRKTDGTLKTRQQPKRKVRVTLMWLGGGRHRDKEGKMADWLAVGGWGGGGKVAEKLHQRDLESTECLFVLTEGRQVSKLIGKVI